MELARWPEIKRLVEEALDLSSRERDVFLATIADEELRESARRLLAISSERVAILDRFRVLPQEPGSLPALREGESVGHYTIVRMLDRGGMGAVYLARDGTNERQVALKLLSPFHARLAPDEHRALARLTHPNIATLYESGLTPEGLRYVAMEYVEGVPLAAFCSKHCPSIESRLRLFRKICAAVAYAHRHLVVHRDLKPSNILVTADGEPKLLDFGIAKLLHPNAETVTLTDPGERSLTLAFASPEQLGSGPTTTATDIYALGILLCLLLTGRLPYRVRYLHELPWAIQNSDALRPSDLASTESDEPGAVPTLGPDPPDSDRAKLMRRLAGDLDAIVLKALRKEAEHRYRSVDDLSEDIRRFLDSEPVTARRGSRRYRAAKFIRRHRSGAVATFLGALLLATSALVLFIAQQKAARERDRAEAVTRFLIDMFALEERGNSAGLAVTVYEILDRAHLKLSAEPPQAPETRGTIRQSLGKIYLDLGLYTPADNLLTAALTDLEASRTASPLLIADTLADLAFLNYHHGQYNQAEGYARRALALESNVPRRSHHLQGKIRLFLGHLAFVRGAFPEAEQRFREALASEDRSHEATLAAANTLNDLACTLHEEGKLREAAALHRKALTIRRKLLGEFHRDTLQSLHNITCLSFEQGSVTASEEDLYRLFHQRFAAYDPASAFEFQNVGTLLAARGRYEEASERLEESLSMRRNLLPDRHPDIGRSFAELGRIAYLRGHRDEADFAYREALKRLTALPPEHPDRIAVENNLTVLAAEQGQLRGEAEASFRELIRRAGQQSLRPSVRRTLAHNLWVLTNHRTTSRGRLQTLAVSALSLTDPGETPMAALPRSPIHLGSRPQVLFADSFEDGIVDPKQWDYGGHSVREDSGQLHLRVDVEDRGGWARTRPIAIDPSRPLVIRRRAKLHAANEYFDGELKIQIVGYPEKRFGVSYANYHYTGDGECVTVGFSLTRRDGGSHIFASRKRNASSLLQPIWDRWFNEELAYNPRTGEVRYSIDGRERLVYNVDPLPPNARAITILVGAWGWYTGHYHYLDDLVVRQ